MTGTSESGQFDRQVVVIGGCGHVGLPLAIAFASRGARVGIFDISEAAVAQVSEGTMPFAEPGAAPELKRAIAEGTLTASADPAIVTSGEHVIVVVGTPVGEHLEPAVRPHPPQDLLRARLRERHPARVHRLHGGLADVVDGNPRAAVREGDGQRQADVATAADHYDLAVKLTRLGRTRHRMPSDLLS